MTRTQKAQIEVSLMHLVEALVQTAKALNMPDNNLEAVQESLKWGRGFIAGLESVERDMLKKKGNR
jgi:hypothetical protein